MASDDNGDSRSRSDEDNSTDQIGTQSGPPSGVATPRPDPSDKRLPGIMHAFMGQVGSHSTSAFTPSVSPSNLHARRPSGVKLISPTGLESPPQEGNCGDPQADGGSEPEDGSGRVLRDSGYPTPPLSQTPSLTHENLESSTSQKGGESGMMGTAVSQPPHKRRKSAIDMLQPRARRLTEATRSHSSTTVTTSSIYAPHLTNPAVDHTEFPSSPTAESQSGSFQSALSSLTANFLDRFRLTQSVAETPRDKSTPPHTPRALSSSNSAEPVEKPPTSGSQSSSVTSGRRADSPNPPVGPPKGKLYVKISEARGLKPSADPYVVAVFEWNEYISKGPKTEAANGKKDGPVPIQRSTSDMGRSVAIPMRSRQSSSNGVKPEKTVTDPKWDHEAIFDVLGDRSDIDFYVYNRSEQEGGEEVFLGHVRVSPNVRDNNTKLEGWYKLSPRDSEGESVTGEIHLQMRFQKTDKKHYGPEDFQILKLIGKGTFGQVYQVRKKDTSRIYAMKVLSKKVIVQKKEVAHTLGERNILVRTAMADSPFIVGLKFSFQTPTDLYLVTDFMSGGELFWHLQREGRFNETRAKFYIAELILALQHLHQHDIVYRDLKPENILLDANGHIALCDFGLSKANLTKDATTNTFCGTTEYLAPEVLLDEQGYTTMVDFWSLGVLVFEMCCGWSPFYAEDTQQMYKNIAFGKVRFPRDALSTEGRNFVKGLLNRNPKHRLGATKDAEELKQHPFFADVDWTALHKKLVVPPFKPKLKSDMDTSNFDPEFTNALDTSSSLNARAAALATGNVNNSTPISPTMQANFKGFTFVDESSLDDNLRHRNSQMYDDDHFDKNDDEEPMSGVEKHAGDDDLFNNHFDN